MRFLLLLALISCQDYNSNSSDELKYAPVAFRDNNPQFQAAYFILRERCVNCHNSNIHNAWSGYLSSQEWVDSGASRVIPGNSSDSNVVYRIINSGHTESNMPLDGAALPNDEYDTIKAWIDGI